LWHEFLYRLFPGSEEIQQAASRGISHRVKNVELTSLYHGISIFKQWL
jgi:hypothetical protein